MTIEFIYQGAEDLINKLIRKEFASQGHTLTGKAERSLNAEIVKTSRTASLIGYGVDYIKILNEGITPDRISDKMLPGLIQFFVLRERLDIRQATLAAVRTLNKMKAEGMSTQASKRFSTTGGRQHFLEAAFLSPEIDEYMSINLDFAMDEEFLKTKSETI